DMVRTLHPLAVLTAVSLAVSALGRSVGFASDDDDGEGGTMRAQIVASGIPGAGAITQIGTFHTGGPFHDRPDFAALPEPGLLLHRARLFVANTSNFGGPLARPSDAPGSILSIDIGGGSVTVPPDFAAGGGQAVAQDGKVMLFAAQSPDFLNSIANPGAV